MLWCSHACLQTCCCSSTMDGSYPVFPDSELSYKEVSLLGFLSLVWWPPSEWDVAHICCRTEMDGWRTMTAQVNPAEESSGIMQTWVHCWKKDTHTHLLFLVWLGASVLYVACSGLLRNAEQNHKWTRHTARQHKTQLAGSCTLSLFLLILCRLFFSAAIQTSLLNPSLYLLCSTFFFIIIYTCL